MAKTSCKRFLEVLTTVLFDVLVPERPKRLQDRNVELPPLFTELLDVTRPFNAPERSGHKRLQQMTAAQLRQGAQQLYDVLLLPWLQAKKWTEILQATRQLANGQSKYADYLESTTVHINATHAQMEPARAPGSGTSSFLE